MTCENPLPGNKLFRASIIKEYSIKFADVKIGQDLNFYIKFLLKTEKLNILNVIIFKYRKVSNSISRTYSLKILDIVGSFKDIKRFYINNNSEKIYNEFVSIAELLHYNGQMSKLTRFKSRLDRKIILLFFKKYAKEITFIKRDYYKSNANTVYKFYLKQLLGPIFICKLGCVIYNKLFDFREKNNLKKF